MSVGLGGQAIITKGLTCGKTRACEGGAMLTAGRFSLFCKPVPPVPLPPAVIGGSRPMAPGEIGQLHKPVQDQFYVVPQEQEADWLRKKLPVTITIKFGEKDIIKDYVVKQRPGNIMVRAINAVNNTKDRISVRVSSLRNAAARVIVKVRNLRNKQ